MENTFFEDIKNCGWEEEANNIYVKGIHRIRVLKTVYRLEKRFGDEWVIRGNAKPKQAACVKGRLRGFIGVD